MVTFVEVKDIILEELRHKGYVPNPADVIPAASRIMEAVKASIDEALLAAQFKANASENKAPGTQQKP